MNLGLKKLIQGAEDVEAMKIVLAEEQKKLEVATLETNKMLSSLEVSSAEAKKEGDQVRGHRKNKRGESGVIGEVRGGHPRDEQDAQQFGGVER